MIAEKRASSGYVLKESARVDVAHGTQLTGLLEWLLDAMHDHTVVRTNG